MSLARNPILILVFSLMIFSSCFGGSIYKKGSVLGYKNGVVNTHGGKFRVGKLSDEWQQKNLRYRAVFFQHKREKSSITIDSWCQSAADDASLETLSRQLYLAVDGFKLSEQEKMRLADRDALRTGGFGKMDGQDVFFSTTVLKMNSCIFDFIYVGFPPNLASYEDFKNMILGFEFVSGPRIL